MKRYLTVLLLMAFAVNAADLPTMKKTLQVELEKIELAKDVKMQGVNKKHLASLMNAQVKGQELWGWGKLEAIAAEIERFKKERNLVAGHSADEFPELAAIEQSYINNRTKVDADKSKAILAMVKKYDGALVKMQNSYIKQGKKAKADEFALEREAVRRNSKVLEAKEVFKEYSAKLAIEKKIAAEKKASSPEALALKKKREEMMKKKPSGGDSIKPKQKVTNDASLTVYRDRIDDDDFIAFFFCVYVKNKVRNAPGELLVFPNTVLYAEFVDGEGKTYFSECKVHPAGVYGWREHIGVYAIFMPEGVKDAELKAYCVRVGMHVYKRVLAINWYGFEDFDEWIAANKSSIQISKPRYDVMSVTFNNGELPKPKTALKEFKKEIKQDGRW